MEGGMSKDVLPMRQILAETALSQGIELPGLRSLQAAWNRSAPRGRVRRSDHVGTDLRVRPHMFLRWVTPAILRGMHRHE